MGCVESKNKGFIFSEQELKECEIGEEQLVQERIQAVRVVHGAGILDPVSCQDNMTWDLVHARRSIFITPPQSVRDLCLFIVSRTHLIAVQTGNEGCCPGEGFAPRAGHVYLVKSIKQAQTNTLEVEMTDQSNERVPRLATSMVIQRPDMTSVVAAIRVSLAHAYYGTPPYAVPFKMILPKSLSGRLPALDEATHQAGGLRSVFLASWSLDPRGPQLAGLATVDRINNGQFTPEPFRYGAIDVWHVAGGDHHCILGLVRALRYNTFFSHLDLSSANASSPDCWNEEGSASDVASGPLAKAVQELLGWNVTLKSFLAPKMPRYTDGPSLLNWEAFGSALLVNPRPMISTWDLTNCGLGDSGLVALLPGWWRIFAHIAPVRELRLSGNGLGQAGLAPFFNMMNGTGFTFSTPQGLNVPPGPLPAANTSFLTRLELGGCDLRGAFPSLAMLLSRCPFLRVLDVSDPPQNQGVALGLQEAVGVFTALVNSLCPLEELDMRGYWSLMAHSTMDSANGLAGLIARKPTLSRVSLGEMIFDGTRTTELDVPIAAAAILTCGADLSVDRKPQTVDLSNSLLLNWPPMGPSPPGTLVVRSCATSLPWYLGLLSYCSVPHSALRRLDISLSFFLLDYNMKNALATGLGHLVASSPLEALIMAGDPQSNGVNCIHGNIMAQFFPSLAMTKTLLELDVTGHGFGDAGGVALGNALRKNRSISTLNYDYNDVTLEGFKAIRGCLYGNKKLVNVSAPVRDLAVRTAYLQDEVALGMQRMREIKVRIKRAYHTNKWEFHRQIELISANNKAWKALERERVKTIEIVEIIAACIASNRELKGTKDAEKSAAKMERQKGAFEERYATKMGKILTKLSKETEKARVHAASTKSSSFQARPRKYYYTSNARKRNKGGGFSDGMYFCAIPWGPPSYHNGGGRGGDEGEGDEKEGEDNVDQHDRRGSWERSASVSPEGEDQVEVEDDYLNDPGVCDGAGAPSNPLDGVRDLITERGPGVFDPSILGRIDDLLREAGADVYDRIGPMLGEAGDFGGKVAETASSWGQDIGSVFGSIGDSAGNVFEGLGGLFSDVSDTVGDGLSGIGDALSGAAEGAIDLAADGVEAAAGVAEDALDVVDAAGDGVMDGLDAARGLAEDVLDAAGDGLDAAGDLAEDVVDAAGDLAEDVVDGAEDLVDGGDGERGAADDVDMYAGAGPRDLDDEGPSGGGNFAKVLSGPRRLVEAFSVQRTSSEHPCLGDSETDRPLIGVEEWTAPRLKAREDRRWEEGMLEMAKEVDRPHAFPYKTKLHAFHAGRALPSQKSRVTLVTQCSADRLHTVQFQALRWGGDISLAVYVPSAPSSASANTLFEIQRLCGNIDRAVKASKGDSGRLEQLSLDVAILEGAEVDPARHDHCGVLYPVNNLRNLALLQARDNNFHPARAVFLVDADCLPSDNLREELHAGEIQDRIINCEGGTKAKDLRPQDPTVSNPAAIVVPCLEFTPGSVAASDAEQGKGAVPVSTRGIVQMYREGKAQGFHVDYFFKGHGPTDFDRWAASAIDEEKGALAYTVPYASCFEPYVVVDKMIAPMYDERFRGYGMNKVAHIFSLASGRPTTGTRKHALKSAEFVVLRRGCTFALSHTRSSGWEKTYGVRRDPLRRYQVKGLWSKFQDEVSGGLPPTVSSSTAAIATSLHETQGDDLCPLPPQPPSYRESETPLATHDDDEEGVHAENPIVISGTLPTLVGGTGGTSSFMQQPHLEKSSQANARRATPLLPMAAPAACVSPSTEEKVPDERQPYRRQQHPEDNRTTVTIHTSLVHLHPAGPNLHNTNVLAGKIAPAPGSESTASSFGD